MRWFWIVLAAVGLFFLVKMLLSGSTSYPFQLRAERSGENRGLFWFAIVVTAALAALGALGAFGILDLRTN